MNRLTRIPCILFALAALSFLVVLSAQELPKPPATTKTADWKSGPPATTPTTPVAGRKKRVLAIRQVRQLGIDKDSAAEARKTLFADGTIDDTSSEAEIVCAVAHHFIEKNPEAAKGIDFDALMEFVLKLLDYFDRFFSKQ